MVAIRITTLTVEECEAATASEIHSPPLPKNSVAFMPHLNLSKIGFSSASIMQNSQQSNSQSQSQMSLAEPKLLDKNADSRMLHAYGAKFVKRLRKLRVAIVGARGVGVEVAKCLTLSGVRLLHIFDDEHVRARDLGSNFALQSNDIGKPRAAATVPFLQRLNESVSVSAMAGLPDPDHYDVIVATRISRASAGALNAACRASVKVRPWAVDETKEADQKLGSQGVPPPPLYPCAFISADAFGVASTIFSDFGPGHVVESVAGQPDIVANIKQVFSGEQTFIEVCNSDKRPVNDLNEGDSCVFNGVAGCDAADVFVVANMKSVFEVVKGVKTAVANLFELLRRDSSGRLTAVNSSAWPSCSLSEASITFSKPGILVSHKPLSEEDPSPELLTMDPFSSPSPQELFAAINVIESFRSSNGGALPRVRNPDDAAACAAIAHPSNPEPNSLAAKVASLADIEVHGLAAFIGGVCAQEVIKVTGLGIPLLGRFVHECLPLDVASTAFVSRDDRYDDLRALLGQDVLDKLHNQRVFLVGAGALGCEYLKGFALAGVGSGPTGAVVVTDMDRIEVSNLNRQFLFRKEHVGALKSECAAASARAMNTSLNIESLSVGVGAKTEATFNDAFWTSKTLIVNALDNVPARRYVDSQCQLYKLSLLESGTEGPKANVQVILEGESATYSEGKDQETETIALCTLKEFPFAIEHTIQWAKVLIFNEEFSEAPSHARDFAQNPQDFFAKIKINASQNARLADLRKTLQFVTRARTVTLDSCVAAAVQCFTQEFDKKIEATISGKPRDAVDEKTGQPVWAPPKRFPTAIKFNHRDESHCKFVAEFAALEATVHGVPLPSDWSADSISRAFETGLFVEKHADGPLTLADGQSEADLLAALEAEALDTTFLAKLAVCVSPQEFEKDDDTNHHIAFISAAANIRAENFSIPTVDEFRVKLIAGKIIAALATTTTAVTGLVAIELLKVAAGLKVDSFKDCMFNLSDSSTNISFEPAPPQRVSCGAAAQRRAMSEIESGQVAPGDAEAAAALAKNLDRAKALEKEMGLAGGFSLWDALTPPDSAQTVGQLADWIQKEFKVRLVRLWFDTQEQDSTDPENPDEGVMPIYAKIFDELFPSLSKRDVRIADKLRSSLQELQLRHPKKGIAGVVGGRQLWRLSWECEDEDDENAVFSVPCILFKIL